MGASWLATGNTNNDFSAFFTRRNELSLHKGCVLWGNRVVIPMAMRNDTLKLLHANHPGMTAMKANARSYVWWPKLDNDVENCVKRCRSCQLNRSDPKHAPRQFLAPTENPWTKLHLDFAGPFQGKVFLVVVDSMSKWVEVKVVKNQSSAEIIRCLREIFSVHGIPQTIISDNGTGFVSCEMKQFCRMNGIHTHTTAPYHPSSNGQAERMVQYVKRSLSTLTEGDFDLRLQRFLFKQHTTVHATTGKAPAELLMGRRLRTALDCLHPDDTRPRAAECRDPRLFSEHDLVYIRNYSTGPKWLAAKIIEVTGPVSYICETTDCCVYRRHVDQIRGREEVPISIEPVMQSSNMPTTSSGVVQRHHDRELRQSSRSSIHPVVNGDLVGVPEFLPFGDPILDSGVQAPEGDVGTSMEADHQMSSRSVPTPQRVSNRPKKVPAYLRDYVVNN